MEQFIPEHLMNLLSISIVFSIVLMTLIQKCKSLSWVNQSWHVWVLNLVFSFLLGIPFGMTFYGLNVVDSAWIGVFSFIGASSLYTVLKNQTMINYHPNSVSDTIQNTVSLPKENEITRDDL